MTVTALCAALAGCSSHHSAEEKSVSTVAEAVTAACDYSVTTAHNDAQRTGLQACETVLTPSTAPYVQKVAQYALASGDHVTAQPLLLHGNQVNGVVQDALVIATNGPSGGFPAIHFLTPDTLSSIYDIVLPAALCQSNSGPTVCAGVLSTPVIDKTANILYVVTGRSSGTGGHSDPDFVLLAYNIGSGQLVASAVIAGTCVGSTTNEPFSAFVPGRPTALNQMQRPALLLDHGHVYVAFGSANSEAAADSYNGWIFAFNTFQSGRPTLTAVGPGPYCTSRQAAANAWGRGGIWQYGAGIAADPNGNVYATTGNGMIGNGLQPANNTSLDDGQSFVRLAGVPWTGVPTKYLYPDYNGFLAANEIEGSSGPVVLPSPSGTLRILNSSKMGTFTLLDENMAVVSQFRASWHENGPILGDPALLEPGGIACNASNSCTHGLPTFSGGTEPCCPAGCSCPNGPTSCGNTYSPCFLMIHGSHPHIHGQPCYLPGQSNGVGATVFWWGEKDYPRSIAYSTSSGAFTQVVTQTSNRVSSDSSDLAPINNDPSNFMMNGMPGGLMSLSSNSGQNVVLWANIPHDQSWPPTTAYLKAFDAINGPIKGIPHILQLDVGGGGGESHGYPTVANGYIYLATRNSVASFSVRPPPSPLWTSNSGLARSIGSGWAIGTNLVGPNGDYGIYQWTASAQAWTQRPGGAQTISVDLSGNPWIVNKAGQIYSWNGSDWSTFGGTSFCATAVASGAAANETWAVHCGDKAIYKWIVPQNGPSFWQQIGGGKAIAIAVFSATDPNVGHLPVVIGTDQNVYFYQDTTGDFTLINGAGSSLTTDLVVGTDGWVYRWNQGAGWARYVTSPFGTTAQIAGWADGVFVASTTTLAIQRLCANNNGSCLQ